MLDQNFGKSGRWFYAVCRGLDDRPVEPFRERKSLGAESTFAKDLENSSEIFRELSDIAEELERRLLQKPFPGKTITLKVKFSDFTQKTRSITEDYSYLDKNELYRIGSKLLEEFILGSGKAIFPIRLLGLSLSHPENTSKKFTDKNRRRRRSITFSFLNYLEVSPSIPEGTKFAIPCLRFAHSCLHFLSESFSSL